MLRLGLPELDWELSVLYRVSEKLAGQGREICCECWLTNFFGSSMGSTLERILDGRRAGFADLDL